MPVWRLLPSSSCIAERSFPYFTQSDDSKYIPAVNNECVATKYDCCFEYSERFIRELVNLCIDLHAALGESVMGNDFRKSLLAAACNFV